MARNHLVRVGVVGRVGRFPAVDAKSYPRGARVVVRTNRGLEIGEVLSPAENELGKHRCDGSILRAMTTQDQLLQSRIQKNQGEAFESCVKLLAEKDVSANLIEVEHLFDGKGLYFYFLGDVGPELEKLTQELADAYDSEVQFRSFAQALDEGCGPECGTSDSCDSCSSEADESCAAKSLAEK